MKISINQQIEEVERELAYRVGVYARAVAAGKMRQGEAEYHRDRMQAVLKTLEFVRDNEQRIRDMLLEGT